MASPWATVMTPSVEKPSVEARCSGSTVEIHRARACLSVTKKRLPKDVTWSGPIEPKTRVPTNLANQPSGSSRMLKSKSQNATAHRRVGAVSSSAKRSNTMASSPPSGMPSAVRAAAKVPRSTSSSIVPSHAMPFFVSSAARMLAGQTSRAFGAALARNTTASMQWWSDGMTRTSIGPSRAISSRTASATAIADHTTRPPDRAR
mmetsp:Transcript_11301/g.45763  ORF Transcript_11301/g.45763 Transcript_11301/m.45763 type:complete len:204 (-) Transcript_11301:187-798(-)